MTDAHAARRPPAEPDVPTDLEAAGRVLLAEAHGMASGRAARSLTPGAHAPLTQTLLALCAGREWRDHETNGVATMQVLVGKASITSHERVIELGGGEWAPIPTSRHNLMAHEDLIGLLTVASTE